MALRSVKLLGTVRNAALYRHIMMSTSVTVPSVSKVSKPKEYKREDNFVYLEDPDTFGTLSGRPNNYNEVLKDEDDIKEHEFLEKLPLPTQKLTIKQYSDIIKQYLKHKRLKEAIDILEVRMLKQDRVKPSNYIYNILIGACAEVGYTKKAFKLYNDMKRRALKATGDTYTCLFEACANSPWALDGLKNASHLRNLMIEKYVEPNLTNYNAMIKAFGRCGDVATAFKIVDEMVAKKIKIRVHTFNHLLQACISDKESGLRHALVVWRKMLKLREKPNIYSFNLMLKCVNECSLGSKENIEELIQIIQEETPLAITNQNRVEIQQIAEGQKMLDTSNHQSIDTSGEEEKIISGNTKSVEADNNSDIAQDKTTNKPKSTVIDPTKEISSLNSDTVSLKIVDKVTALKTKERTVPNLLSKRINMNQVLSLQEVHTIQEKFAVIGGLEDFLKEMEEYSIKPDIKTFTQILMVLDDNIEAENKLIEIMEITDVKADISFYNMLIKKRCLRADYENAMGVKEIIEKEDKCRKRKWPMKKKWRLKPNVMTYGVLAMSCKTMESAEQLLNEMKDKQLKVNAQILGTLLRHGTAQNNFSYVVYIMKLVKEENLKVNDVFVKHLEAFNDKCLHYIQKVDDSGQKGEAIKNSYKRFINFYTRWLQDIYVKDVLESEHPWKQFREDPVESFQRPNYEIVEPKRFYKRDRRFKKYNP